MNLLSHLQALQETDPSLSMLSMINLDLFLEGPEDDSKVETCRPKIMFYVINGCVLTDILYYICIR